MIDYRIPQHELLQALNQTDLEPEHINILWKAHVNGKYNQLGDRHPLASGKAHISQEQYIIYNALRGEPLFKGRTGKCELQYFKSRLAGSPEPSHPYFQFYYQVANFSKDLNIITQERATPLDGKYQIEKIYTAHNKRKTWFSWLNYKPVGKDWKTGRTNLDGLLKDQQRNPLIFLTAKHVKVASELLLARIFKDREQFKT